MLNFLFLQITRSVGVIVRTLRAFFSRRLMGLRAWLRRVMNFSRGATKAATQAVQSAATVTQKPTKRDDYVKAGGLLLAKSFLVKIILGIAAAAALIYFVLWPFVLGHFLTARFYQGDSRISDWDGRVIVYADQKKQIPMYEGRLEKGRLQGQGSQYDADGLLTYEGAFQDGFRAGSGKAYKDGVLAYVGQFDADVYEGSGSAYEDGLLVYEGQFSGGVYQGQGALYKDGILIYEGSFRGGTAEGDGVAYDLTGAVQYRGQFAAGVPEGIGKVYDASGRLLYQGEFSGGLYDGEGTLYPEAGQQVEATFLKGSPDGTVRWSKGGKLYYEGEWNNGKPDGFGMLYDRSGTVIYQGRMKSGVPDGAWLLGMTAEELRGVLGEENTESRTLDQSAFLVTSGALGLAARCSYQTEAEPSAVQSVCLFRPERSDWVQLLPEGDDDVREIWPSGDKGWDEIGALALSAPAAADAGAGHNAPDRTERFLNSLDRMHGTGSVVPMTNPYYGTEPCANALAACASPEQMGELIANLADYWLMAETQSGLEENLARTETLLEQAKSTASMGQGKDDAVKVLEAEKLSLEGRIQSCQTQRKQTQLQAQYLTGVDPAQFALGELMVQFDPAEQDVSELALTAAAYAQASGNTADSSSLELEIKLLLVALEDAYGSLETAKEQYANASDDAESAAGDYAMGGLDRAAWYEALTRQSDARTELYRALCEFTIQANELNLKTGGWVSRTCGWYEEEMSAVFHKPRTQEAPAVQEPAAEPADEQTDETAEGKIWLTIPRW